MDTISLDRGTLLKRSDRILEADVHGQTVALHIEHGQCYGMNIVATRIWQLLTETQSCRDIASTLVQEFEIDTVECEAEVLSYCRTLLAEGMIKRVG